MSEMDSNPPQDTAQSTSSSAGFSWGQLDHGLISLKLQTLSEDIRKEMSKEERTIRFQNRLNLNSGAIPHLLLEMHERRTDEWAKKAYQIYCDVWRTQGGTKSGDFVRAVYTNAVVRLIERRTSAVITGLNRLAKQTGLPTNLLDLQVRGFRLKMGRLNDSWRRRLAVEARECEHAARLGARPGPQSSPNPPAPQADQTAENGPQVGVSNKPIKSFDFIAGELLDKEIKKFGILKRLPNGSAHPAWISIAKQLDERRVDLSDNLPPEARGWLAHYNQAHNKAAIKTWEGAIINRRISRRLAQKRLYRARDRYLKAQP